MSSIAESIGSQSPIAGAMHAGVEAISAVQHVTFTKYMRVVLPLDGFVFWVRADLLSRSALYNAALYNEVVSNQPQRTLSAASVVRAKGSFHYGTDVRQDETETLAVRRVVFTSEVPVQDLSAVGPTMIYIGEFQGVRFAFSQRQSFYQQAGTYHYTGDAIYSDMASLIIDQIAGFNATQLVVSNSLPIWLTLNGYVPPYAPSLTGAAVGGFDIGGSAIGASKGSIISGLVLYPSFVVPNNLPPPYGSVHIESTRALQGSPRIGRLSSHHQLVSDRVRITMYGLRNNSALDFLDAVDQFTLDTDAMGIMNMPVVQDEKRTQRELATLAMKKTIDYEVSYYQATVRQLARQLILQAIPTYFVNVPVSVDAPIGEFAIGESAIG